MGVDKRIGKLLVRIVAERRMPPSDQLPAKGLLPVRGFRPITVSRHLVRVTTGRIRECVEHVDKTIVVAGNC